MSEKKPTRRRIVWALLLVGSGLGFALAARLPRVGTPPASASGRIPEPDASWQGTGTTVAGVELAPSGRPYRGPEDALVTIVEFTDYQCPFCRRHFEETLPLILRDYGERVKYVVRNFPIVQSHPSAARAAEAAECAFDQGRFWPYHDLLFRNPTALDAASLKRYARDVGLDMQRFTRCLDSREKSSVVARDLRDAERLGLRGTPTFFINGRILVGAQPYPVFRAYIEDAFEQAGSR